MESKGKVLFIWLISMVISLTNVGVHRILTLLVSLAVLSQRLK